MNPTDTMASTILGIARGGSRRSGSSSSDSSTQLTSLPPTETSFSAGSVASVDSYPEVPYTHSSSDDDDDSYDPYLRPLMKQRKTREKRKMNYHFPNILKKSPVKQPSTPETAYSFFADDSVHGSAPDVPDLDLSSPPSTLQLTKKISAEKAADNRSVSAPNVPDLSSPPSTLQLSKKITTEKAPDTRSVSLQTDKEDTIVVEARKERRYWERIVEGRVAMLGIVHVQTAEGLMNLGNAHMECEVCVWCDSFIVIYV